jgi:hypothetical protein
MLELRQELVERAAILENNLRYASSNLLKQQRSSAPTNN